jgi:hypothetical protein
VEGPMEDSWMRLLTSGRTDSEFFGYYSCPRLPYSFKAVPVRLASSQPTSSYLGRTRGSRTRVQLYRYGCSGQYLLVLRYELVHVHTV